MYVYAKWIGCTKGKRRHKRYTEIKGHIVRDRSIYAHIYMWQLCSKYSSNACANPIFLFFKHTANSSWNGLITLWSRTCKSYLFCFGGIGNLEGAECLMLPRCSIIHGTPACDHQAAIGCHIPAHGLIGYIQTSYNFFLEESISKKLWG